MIKNEKQYEYSKECARRFEYSIAVVEQDEAWKQRDPERWQLDKACSCDERALIATERWREVPLAGIRQMYREL